MREGHAQTSYLSTFDSYLFGENDGHAKKRV